MTIEKMKRSSKASVGDSLNGMTKLVKKSVNNLAALRQKPQKNEQTQTGGSDKSKKSTAK
jgi:hypothetical protein